ncbi:hypothetical protein ARALYDRAFT_475148 [Arabidopsis lyrata subsp. lyrata]|uniref:Glycosyl hydrolase family 1 protein n=2 Tax=Arabidopsis lyrata subsp. lyrata TaxID=81972 RepID=D7KVF1_ARALL|nr:hypothetical protein ARALYDRAFT_475148 [Arabidopsis lyrata subsp. lyrata]
MKTLTSFVVIIGRFERSSITGTILGGQKLLDTFERRSRNICEHIKPVINTSLILGIRIREVILLQSLLFHVYGHHQSYPENILEDSSLFLSDFLFGTASSANQEDIQLMTFLGVISYRFSISWCRILPRGRFGEINYLGIKYYNKLIDALISRGIKPFVTLNHLVKPRDAVSANICFKHFGNRVKYWTTLNEPNQQLILGYLTGKFPPSRCSSPYGNCSQGNSETEPFIATHNMILAHAKAVNIYQTKYQKEQKGSIGIVVQTSWFEPISESNADKEAAERAQSFYSNWILDPVIYGKYPKEMVNILGPALPQFSSNEVKNLENSRADFIGINHYTSYFIQDCLTSACNTGHGAFKAEGFAHKLDRKGNVSIGELTDVDWQHIDLEGFHKMLNYLKDRYPNIRIFITENGFGDLQKPETTDKELLHDTKRIQYMSGYLEALQAAMRDGANVKGYFVWSLLDNFEWLFGYKVRFGLFHVDLTTLKRTPKQSASWYKNFIEGHVNRRDLVVVDNQ